MSGFDEEIAAAFLGASAELRSAGSGKCFGRASLFSQIQWFRRSATEAFARVTVAFLLILLEIVSG